MFQQLRSTANSTQRILDFVRQVADQLTIRLLLLDQPFLTRRLQLLIDRPQLDDQPRPRRLGRADRAINVQRLAVVASQLDVLPGIVPVVRQRVVERRLQDVRIGHCGSERLAEQNFDAGRQQILRRRIHVNQGQMLVQQNDGRRKVVESTERMVTGLSHVRQLKKVRCPSAKVGDFLADRLDVALVQGRFVLEGLQAFLDFATADCPALHPFIGQHDRILLSQILLRLLKVFLFGRKLAFENTPAIRIAGFLGAVIHLGESRRRWRSWRGLARRGGIHRFKIQLPAILGFYVGIGHVAVGIDTLVNVCLHRQREQRQ